MTAEGRFRKLTSRKNNHWQWFGPYLSDDNCLTRFSVPLRLKPLDRIRHPGVATPDPLFRQTAARLDGGEQ